MADNNRDNDDKLVWPWWTIGVMAMIGILWWAVESTENSGVEQTKVNPIVPGVGVSSDADLFEEAASLRRTDAGYVSFIKHHDNRDKIGDDPEATGEALIKLSAALRNLVTDEELNNDLDRIEKDGKQIKENHALMDNADKLNSAFTSVAALMSRIQERDYPHAIDEVNEVKVAADQLSTDEDLFAQRAQVTSFFDEAAEAIQKMENSGTQDK